MELLTFPSTDHQWASSPPQLPAARTVNAVKVYGKGDTAVRALEDQGDVLEAITSE